LFSANLATGGAGAKGADAGNRSLGGAAGDGGSATGAAIFNTGNGLVTIYSSTFSSNQVTGSTGGLGGSGSGVFGFPGERGDSGSALGGALFNQSGTVSIVNSTFVGNSGSGSAGTAGPGGSGTFEAQHGTSGGQAYGGGIFNAGGSLTLTNCTFV